MNCTDCPYYKQQCEYGADHIICSKHTKEAQNERKKEKNNDNPI